jgi:hypothetical protein
LASQDSEAAKTVRRSAIRVGLMLAESRICQQKWQEALEIDQALVGKYEANDECKGYLAEAYCHMAHIGTELGHYELVSNSADMAVALADEVGVSPEKTFISMIPKTADASSIVVDYTLPAEIEAPVKKGQVVGSAVVKIAGQPLGEIKLAASADVGRNPILYAFSVASDFITSSIFLIIAAVIAIPILGYLLLNILYKRKISKGKRYDNKKFKRKRRRTKNIFR